MEDVGGKPLTTNKTQDTPAFQYDELKDPMTYMRLLEITTNDDGNANASGPVGLRFKIATVDSSEMPEYEALSYTWGASDTLNQIYLNDRRFYVKDNLHAFLQDYLRRAEVQENMLLWIDAICINQEDPSEKGHQVQSMGRIYQRAHRVIIWPDQETRADENRLLSSSTAKNLSKRMPDRIENALAILVYTKNGISMNWKGSPFTRLRFGSDVLRALESFFQLPYWHRTWIVQETVVAKTALLRYGLVEISLDTLDRFTTDYRRLRQAVGAFSIPMVLTATTLERFSDHEILF